MAIDLASHTSAPSRRGARLETLWEGTRSSGDSWARLQDRISSQTSAPNVDLWLVRHGETTTNARGLITGTTDAPLTSRGRDQARSAGRELAGHSFDVAFHSSLRRSGETLEILLRSGPSAAVVLPEDRIMERSLGELELTEAVHIEEYARGDLGFAPSDGETYRELTRRCLEFLLDLRSLAEAADSPLSVLVCTHVGPMRIIAGILQKMADPREVLALHYANSRPARWDVGRLAFPPFL